MLFSLATHRLHVTNAEDSTELAAFYNPFIYNLLFIYLLFCSYTGDNQETALHSKGTQE